MITISLIGAGGKMGCRILDHFDRVNFPFSDGARLLAEYGGPRVLRADWIKVFEPDRVREQVRVIVSGQLPPGPPS
jgi:hypothetical protein